MSTQVGWRSAAVNLLVLALGVVAALLIAEGSLRVMGYDYSPLQIQSREQLEDVLPTTPSDDRAVHLFQDHQFIYDAQLIWKPRAGMSVFNSQGFRGPELASPKPLGEIRVFAFGDSNTLGWNRRAGAHWPGMLGEMLRRLDPRIVTVNAGVWGYSLFQGRKRLEQSVAFQPDLVLVSYGSNDAHPVFRTDAEYQRRLLGVASSGLSRLRIVQLVMSFRSRVVTPRRDAATQREKVHRVPLDEYRGHLDAVAELAETEGFDCVFLTRPYTGRTRDQSRWKYYASEYQRATLEAAADAGVWTIDLEREFRQHERLFRDESHFTREGHVLAAKRIYDDIAPRLIERHDLKPERLLPAGPELPEELRRALDPRPRTRGGVKRALASLAGRQ